MLPAEPDPSAADFAAPVPWRELLHWERMVAYAAWGALALLLPYELAGPALVVLALVFCWPALRLPLGQLVGWGLLMGALGFAAWGAWQGHWLAAAVLAAAAAVAGWRRARGGVGLGAAVLAGVLVASSTVGLVGQWQRAGEEARRAGQTRPTQAEDGTLRQVATPATDFAQPGATIWLMQHPHDWIDLHDTTYHGTLAVAQHQYLQARHRRETLRVATTAAAEQVDLLAGIYYNLEQADATRLPYVYQLFDSLRVARALDREAFAQCIVSCVQNIAYVLVHDGSCDDYDALGTPHDRRTCLPRIRFGVQAPSEFMYNLKGDCDTRVVFLHTVLRHYGYDAVVLLSLHYRHCVLGLNQPTAGTSFVDYQGRRYFAWETTSRGYPLGVLAPDVNDMRHWQVKLAQP